MPSLLWEDKVRTRLAEFPKFIYEASVPITDWQVARAAWDQRSIPAFSPEDLEPFELGDRWGGPNEWRWFFAKCTIPPEWEGEKVAIYLFFGREGEWEATSSEALLYINGKPLHGLDTRHQEVVFPAEYVRGGRELDLAVKAFTGMNAKEGAFTQAKLVKINPGAEEFYYLLRNAFRAALTLDEKDPVFVKVAQFIDRALQAVDYRKPGSEAFYASVAKALEQLKEDLSSIPASEFRPVVVGVGHSHIDVAWLWQLHHTREKCSRTFSTALRLMEQYPEFVYIQSQAQLYKYIKEDYPDIYRQIKEQVAAGRWEANGAMWVEADCNVTSGESLVRQILFGTRFFEKEFGVKCNTLWLPDVFGYSWALPQIIKKSGLDYFMTTKISWSQFNRFPYDTFRWRGIDGTEVLTHYITTKNKPGDKFYTYNGFTDADVVKSVWDQYQQKDINNLLLSAYGYGDGGGGVTREMLENARAMKYLNFMPEFRLGKAGDFFEELDAAVADDPRLPVWHGELYLELHRGTYTSQGRTKRANRKSEFLLSNAELYSSLAHALVPGFNYAHEEINRAWELVLVNQFHDIIPGSSIGPVYEDSEKQYAEVKALGSKVLAEAANALISEMNVEAGELVVFNPLTWERSDLVLTPWRDDLEGAVAIDDDGSRRPIQKTEVEGEAKAIFWAEKVPAKGYKVFKVEKSAMPGSTMKVTTSRMENDFFLLTLDEYGRLSRIYDKIHQREVLAPGAVGNALLAFEDKPINHDAWDIDIFYQDKSWEITDLREAKVLENGPEKAVVGLRWQFMDSTIDQKIILYQRIPRIDFETEVDWHEHQVLLKVAFPVNVYASKATYDIQFGNVERPTHWNTSWDYARFEVVGHKWADLSQRDYGVSLLNDCKYGHDIKDNVIRLTLIKSGIVPDPNADQGLHRFTYSLYPHAGGWYEGKTVQEAYSLNNPLFAVAAEKAGSGRLPRSFGLVESVKEGIVLETVKKAEDTEDLILRFYEYGGGTVQANITPNLPAKELAIVDLMERPLNEIIDNGQLTFTPYEIHTVKVTLDR
ncbi:MAG: alpha-mannosidase [Firmicutes bacterium]|nr:alpha-mannosidase [Bacillota bacterium]